MIQADPGSAEKVNIHEGRRSRLDIIYPLLLIESVKGSGRLFNTILVLPLAMVSPLNRTRHLEKTEDAAYVLAAKLSSKTIIPHRIHRIKVAAYIGNCVLRSR